MDMRIGIIGAGTHGARYLKHAAEDVPGMQPVAICRRDTGAGAALAAEWNCRYTSEAMELIADPDLDGILVVTPPSTHFAFAAASLQAGKSVLLEKPMTGTLDEARLLAKLTHDIETPRLMVAQTLRWNPVLLKIKDLLPRIGRIRLIRIVQRLEPTTLDWQRDREQTIGGSVLLTGVHLFDTVRFLCGREFTEVYSRQEKIINPEVEDLFLAQARLDDGTYVSLEVSKYGQSRICLCEIVGEQGQLLGDYYFGGIRLIRGAEVEEFTVPASAPTLPPVLRAWRESWLKKTKPPVDSTDGLRSLEMVDACYRSAASGTSTSL